MLSLDDGDRFARGGVGGGGELKYLAGCVLVFHSNFVVAAFLRRIFTHSYNGMPIKRLLKTLEYITTQKEVIQISLQPRTKLNPHRWNNHRQ
jgi:hypothetical protein